MYPCYQADHNYSQHKKGQCWPEISQVEVRCPIVKDRTEFKVQRIATIRPWYNSSIKIHNLSVLLSQSGKNYSVKKKCFFQKCFSLFVLCLITWHELILLETASGIRYSYILSLPYKPNLINTSHKIFLKTCNIVLSLLFPFLKWIKRWQIYF